MAIRNYLKVFADGHTEATKFRPLFQEGERQRAYTGENPDVLVDGKWWNSTNGTFESVTNGTFDNDITGISILNGTVTHDTSVFTNGGLKIVSNGATSPMAYYTLNNLVIGRSYNVSVDAYAPSSNIANNSATISIDDVAPVITDSSAQTSVENTVQKLSIDFIATSDTSIIYFLVLDRNIVWGSNGDTAYFDNLSVPSFEPEIIPDTVYPTQFTYMAKDDKLASFLIEDGQPVDITFDDDSPSIVQNVIQAGRFISQDLVLSNLTTVDPFILGAVWNDSNTLKISQG